MPINFDALPTDKPYSLPDPGLYLAQIEKAEMKSPKDPAKKPYLSLQYQLYNKEGKKSGKLFDLLPDSEHEFVLYKLSRFIKALEIPMHGNFELKDLTKIVVGKQMLVDVTIDNKGDKPRAVVDAMKDAIYYPVSTAQELFGRVYVGENETINAPDALDMPDSEMPDNYEY